MKLVVATVLAVLLASAAADDANWDIDWSKVVPVTDLPGFWDGRIIKPFSSTTSGQSGRIVGGEIAEPNAHPYQVGLLMAFATGTGLCGGSVLNSRNILTAAHCLQGSSSTQVVMGAHQITTVEPNQQRQTVQAADYRLHADYNPENLQNDIAILHLPNEATLNEFVAATVLPTTLASDLFVGEQATISGWGRTSDAIQGTSPVLRFVTQPVITNAVCAATYGGVIIPSTICIATSGGRSACNGDSGGPLTIQREGQTIQIGIAVFVSSSGCEAGLPGGFARVTSFLDWIAANQQS